MGRGGNKTERIDIIDSYDPRVTGRAAQKGTIFRYIPSVGSPVILTKDDDGFSTNWVSAGGEVNTASNLGAGTGVFAAKVGVDLQFKSLTAGTNVTLTPSADEIQISATDTGEVNTASNLGAGAGVFSAKVVADLQFKSLTAGTNITLTPSADEIQISASGSSNIRSIAANDTLLPIDGTILLDSSGGAFNLTLCDPATVIGTVFRLVDKTGFLNANNVTLVRFAGELIEGLAASKLLQTNWGFWQLVSDGTDWYIG